jgi:D-3-phosphoglycerate dehydrogenase
MKCAPKADFLTLHLPVTPQTKHLFNAERLARCKKGIRICQHRTRRAHRHSGARRSAAIRSGRRRGDRRLRARAPADWTLAELPNVVATPHIAASTGEAQELVASKTAAAVRDYLRDGVIRNAVNFRRFPPEEFRRLQPWVTVAERLGSLVAQMGEARISAVGVRYYGELARGRTDLLASAVLVGLFRRMLSGGVSPVNAKALPPNAGSK